MEKSAMSDRDEQIRRLSEHLRFGGAQGFQGTDSVAAWAYSLGARIPDPPKPTLPVVSEHAVRAFNAAWGGVGSPPPTLYTMDCLRAAWPIILRDSIAALRLGPFDNISNETMCAIFRQLAGAP